MLSKFKVYMNINISATIIENKWIDAAYRLEIWMWYQTLI